MGGLMNYIQSSFENLSQGKIQNAIDIQPKVMEAMIDVDDGHTTYMSSGSAKKWELILMRFQLNFDMKNVCTMRKLMVVFVVVSSVHHIRRVYNSSHQQKDTKKILKYTVYTFYF